MYKIIGIYMYNISFLFAFSTSQLHKTSVAFGNVACIYNSYIVKVGKILHKLLYSLLEWNKIFLYF